MTGPLSLTGYYMFIEASRPRAPGDRARLLSPLYNVTVAKGPKGSGRLPYCISFYYHMKGKHIGEPCCPAQGSQCVCVCV